MELVRFALYCLLVILSLGILFVIALLPMLLVAMLAGAISGSQK